MNAQYLGNWLGNVFHGEFTGNSIETSFGISIPVQFSELKQTIHLGKRYTLSVNSSVDELVYNCTRVIADALVDNYKLIIKEFGTSSILAWPYNCNFNYLEDGQYYLETGFGMEEDEDEFDYYSRTRLNSATDLYLYAENSQNVYDRMIPILENLSRKIRRGIYNGNKALNAFENIMDFAAQEYDRELGSGRGSLTLFNKATRREAAKKLMERFEGDLYDMAGEVKSSLYKIYPTEGADNYQYKSFNSEFEAEDFCKTHGYTEFEVINEHPFEKRINNSRAKRR